VYELKNRGYKTHQHHQQQQQQLFIVNKELAKVITNNDMDMNMDMDIYQFYIIWIQDK